MHSLGRHADAWESGLCLVGGGGQGGFLVKSLVDGAGSYSVAHRAGLPPTELTGMWGWILLRSPHQGRGSPPAPAPTQQRPGGGTARTPYASKTCRTVKAPWAPS